MNDFIREFKDRGFFYQCTDEVALSKILNKESLDDINEFIEKSIQYIFNKNYD